MTEQEIRTILNRQREYFATGATLSRKFRAEQLGKLKASLQRHEEELNAALQQDLGKSRMESYMCEIGLTLSELELPGVTDAGSAERCHSCRKYGGGEAQCICSGDGSCAEKYSGRMFSDRIRGCDHRRQNGESGIIAAAV